MIGNITNRAVVTWQVSSRLLTSATSVLVLTTLGTLLTRMVSSVTLTRLLSPESYGLVGIIGSVFFTIALLTDLGFQSYVVRHPDGDDHRFQDVIWTIHATRGVMLAGTAMVCAPVVALAFGKPEVTWPLAVAALTFAIDGAASLSLITHLRVNRSRTLSLLDLALTVFQTIVSICLAFVLHNVWAIIGSMILSTLFKNAASYRIATRGPHRLVRDRAIAREFWGYSKLIMASSFLTMVIGQADKFALGRLLTLGEFGLYTTAITLASAPQGIANSYPMRILYPIYAQTVRDARERLGDIYYTAGRHFMRLYWFGGGFLIAGAPLIVKILYDPRYLAAGTYLSFLAIGTLLVLSNRVSASLLLAMGNTRFTLNTNVVRLGWITVATPVAYWAMGAQGIALAVGTMECPVYVFSALVLRRIGLYQLRNEAVYFAFAGAGLACAMILEQAVLTFLPGIR